MLTLRLLKSLYPDAPARNRAKFAAQSPELFEKYGISVNLVRMQMFLAQTGHESAGLKIQAENLNYSAARLRQVWPRRFRSDTAAAAYAGRPEALANLVYGGRMGNTRPGDGYLYRGRGYIQLTGREAYRAVGQRIGLPLEDQPDLALDLDHVLHIACGFWDWKDINPVCDTGDFVAVTRRINGGTVGLEDRYAWLARVRVVLPEIPVSSARRRTARR